MEKAECTCGPEVVYLSRAERRLVGDTLGRKNRDEVGGSNDTFGESITCSSS